MLQIRPEQIAEFERVDVPEFEASAVNHLRKAFLKHSEILGEDGIGEVIRYGIEQGKTYGFTQRSEVTLFIDLTLLLGREFHLDPQLPWASKVLSSAEPADQLEKSQRLHAEAVDYLDEVSGPDNEFIDAAQERVLQESIEIASVSPSEFQSVVSTKLERIWPEKFAYLGEEGIRDLVQYAVTIASGYGITSDRGRLVFIGLMYMLGTGFDRDPLFSWARVVLDDEEHEGDERAKVGKLYEAAIQYLTQWCA